MNSFTDIVEPKLIHGYLEVAATSQPDHTACTYLEESLSYGELDLRANQLARHLQNLGIKPGDRVGIYMPKSIVTPVALYGIMKSGAAYVPLDPSAPVDRISGLCKDCDIRCIVSSPAQSRKLRQLALTSSPVQHVIGVDGDYTGEWHFIPWATVAQESGESLALPLSTEDLAYIIYTSGSTGVPKGMMHSHRSGLSFSRWAVSEFGFSSADRLSNHAPLHFDLSIMDYFASIIAGATVVIVPEEYTKLPASYTQLVADQSVTVLYTVPFAFTQMLLHGALEQRDLSKLRYAIFGGEPFSAVYLRALMQALPHVTFVNMYGPAEVNGVSQYRVPEPPDEKDSVPIGKINDNAEALVVDANDNPVASGETGELLVCSPTMMLGYWRRQDMTSASLFRTEGDDRRVFYRTGDLVEVMPGGVMRFIGRKDRQVKVRGYRVELDEIELALTALDAVEEGAAYVVESGAGVREVYAETTLRQSGVAEIDLMRALKKILPWYALPAQLTTRTEFPRTATGKIDRRTLQKTAQMQMDGANRTQRRG